jgi:metal-dependent HD superfamily phosphatase/phosphodiesterase
MDDTGLNKSAVIVFESLKENGLDPETLDHGMKGVNGQALVNLMRALKHMEPSVSLAKKMGF